MFSPGMILPTAAMGPWKSLRNYDCVKSYVRGVNAAAVGFVYTAVYRLWMMQSFDGMVVEKSRLDKGSLWWVVIAVAPFAGGMWFRLPACYGMG